MKSAYPSADVFAACRLAWAKDTKGLLELTEDKRSKDLLSTRDVHGFAPIHYATGSAEVTSMLLDSEGVDENCRDDEDLETPLHHAARLGNKEVIEILINNGAFIDVQSGLGETPLTIAVAQGFREIVSLLLESGANPNLAGLHGETALHIAAASGDEFIANLLLKYGAFVNATEDVGDAPLHWAVRESHEKVISVLLKHPEVDVNLANEDGETPLHLAASFGETSIAELLLSTGADAEIRNEAGFKAAEEAANGGYVRLAQLLQPERHMSYETFEVKRDSLLSPSGLSKQDMHKGFGTSPYAQSMFAL